MAMQKQLWSINGLATETGIDRRTLCKRLDGLRPAKIDGKIKLYRLSDALSCCDIRNTEGDEPVEQFEAFLQEFVPALYGELAPGLASLILEASDLSSDRIWKIFEEGYIYVYCAMAKALDCDQESVKLRVPDLLERLKDTKERKILIKWLDQKKRRLQEPVPSAEVKRQRPKKETQGS